MFGRLTLEALPLYSAIAAGGAAVTVGGALVVAIVITWLGAWRYLWTDWLTSVDHKRIGILYGLSALFFFVIGGIEALIIRTQLAQPGQHARHVEPTRYVSMRPTLERIRATTMHEV